MALLGDSGIQLLRDEVKTLREIVLNQLIDMGGRLAAMERTHHRVLYYPHQTIPSLFQAIEQIVESDPLQLPESVRKDIQKLKESIARTEMWRDGELPTPDM